MSMRSKGDIQFDPILIVCQIIALQCFFYLALGALFGVCHALFDIELSLDHFFTARYINLISMFGLIDSACLLCAAVAG
jgi:hypothetical protein